MKCFKCGTDNLGKERIAESGKCKSCRHPFVFDPQQQSRIGLTDRAFEALVYKTSVGNTLKFTPIQLYYAANYRARKKMEAFRGCLPILMAILGLGFFLIGMKHGLAWMMIASACVLFLVPVCYLNFGKKFFNEVFLPTANLPESEFYNLLEKWRLINGPLESLIQTNTHKSLPDRRSKHGAAKTETPAQHEISPELLNYSFDRAVIVDSDDIANFLISNNFHFENNCAVLSINKYPQSIFDVVMEMLRKNSQLKVYALHNATPEGMLLAHKLRTDPTWFANQEGVTVYDLGIFPRQMKGSNVLRKIQNFPDIPEEIRPQLTEYEKRFYAQRMGFELSAFSPRNLLRIVTNGIALSKLSPDDSGDMVLIDSSGGTSDYYLLSSDSFG